MPLAICRLVRGPPTKKKRFQVTRFPALLSTGMLGTKQCIEKVRVLRRCAPPRPISLPQDQCSRRTAVFLPNGAGLSRRPFPRLQRPLPLRSHHSRVNGLWPDTSRPSGWRIRPVHPRLPCLRWFAPVAGRFFASDPLRLRQPVRSAASAASTPLRDFYLPRDQSVQQFLPPCGPPSELARFPLAPRRRFYF